ncbi:MAG: PAS domain-containing protein [Deltaproteobacteria bacterium]|jgi:PAS domain S-box-containing protein|nr:PAS domain-containing protein [Deltaproteobacteria bacterium]
MRKKNRPDAKNLPLTPGIRALLFCIGFFLILQAIFLVVFIVWYISGLDSAFSTLLGIWSVLSALGGGWLMLKTAQGADDQNPAGIPGRYALLGPADNNLSLASLCSRIQEGMVLLQDEKIIYANPALAYLLGMQEDDLIGTGIQSYIHPEDLDLLDLSGSNQDFSGPNRSTLRLTTSLGDYRWVIGHLNFMFVDGQETLLLLFENIGPLKQAQRSLEEHEQQSRIFLERTPLGVAMFAPHGQLKIANTAWHSVFSNITGPMPKRFNILQDQFLPQSGVEQAVLQAFNKKSSGVDSLEHSTPWGETRWFNINFHPMLAPAGNLIGVMMIQQDITDQVRSIRRENELSEQLNQISQTRKP